MPSDLLPRLDLFPRLAWQAKRSVLRFGATGWAGAAMLALSGAFYYLEVSPRQDMLEQLRFSVRELQGIQHDSPDASPSTETARGQVDHFYQILFNEQRGPDSLVSIYEAAKSFNLSLDKGDYVMVRDPDNKIVRYEITLPLRGPYIQVRKFLSKILANTPGLTLNSIGFQRQKVGDTAIEAQVKLTLFMAAGK